MITIDLGYAAIYAGLACLVLIWVYLGIHEQAKARYYWIGRRDGWNMHRRMIDNKVKSDEVFDYDKQS
jgi:hypothetical protein